MNETIIKSLNWRYATKQFDTQKKLSIEQLDILSEALRLSPSSFGLQPWKFILVENETLRERIRQAAWNQPQIIEASNIFVLSSIKNLDEAYINKYVESVAKARQVESDTLGTFKARLMDYSLNLTQIEASNWMKKQVYIALGVLLTTAAINQIDACPMEGFDKAAVDDILELKEKGLESVVICALGYRDNKDTAASYTKVRFTKEEVIEKI